MSNIDAISHFHCKYSKKGGPLPGFRSFKTQSSIAYLARWHHDLLIQLTLDRHITTIMPSCKIDSGETFHLKLKIDGCIRSLIAIQDKFSHHISNENDSIVVSRSVVLSEPSLSNARAVWSTRKAPVSPSDRLRVIQRLVEHPDGLAISQLTGCIQNSSVDPIDAILALACLGLAVLDATSPLCPETKIRRGVKLAC